MNLNDYNTGYVIDEFYKKMKLYKKYKGTSCTAIAQYVIDETTEKIKKWKEKNQRYK